LCFFIDRKPLDRSLLSVYNVITMITTIINIGNSRGVRIPKPLLNESGLGTEVELQVKKGEIKIVAAPAREKIVKDTLLLSEKSLGDDWSKPEEDAAWKSLQ
jgi:antitoxin MazE